MKQHLPLIALACFALLAPEIAAAASSSNNSRSCNWDRQTGRMICKRRAPSPSAPEAPPPKPQPDNPPAPGSSS